MSHIHCVTGKPCPAIKLQGVKSSQIKEVGYDPATKTLAVSFTRGTGAVYHYAGVEPDEYQKFSGAESIGKHFGKHIKSRAFEKYVPKPVSLITPVAKVKG